MPFQAAFCRCAQWRCGFSDCLGAVFFVLADSLGCKPNISNGLRCIVGSWPKPQYCQMVRGAHPTAGRQRCKRQRVRPAHRKRCRLIAFIPFQTRKRQPESRFSARQTPCREIPVGGCRALRGTAICARRRPVRRHRPGIGRRVSARASSARVFCWRAGCVHFPRAR